MPVGDDRNDNYRKAFAGTLAPGAKPALILIDFVQAYFEPDNPLYADVDEALASARRVRDVARECAVPVIYTNVVYHSGGVDGGRFFEKVAPLASFLEGNPMGAWPRGLDPAEDELVVSKQYPSAFFGTSLSATLASQGIDTLILTGLTTSGCVRATCVDTISHGLVPIVVADACGDRHAAPHEANLFDMQAKYAEVVSEQDAVDYLRAMQSPDRRP